MQGEERAAGEGREVAVMVLMVLIVLVELLEVKEVEMEVVGVVVELV